MARGSAASDTKTVPSPRAGMAASRSRATPTAARRSEEHTSELQSPCNLVCRLLLEKKKRPKITMTKIVTGDDSTNNAITAARKAEESIARQHAEHYVCTAYTDKNEQDLHNDNIEAI